MAGSDIRNNFESFKTKVSDFVLPTLFPVLLSVILYFWDIGVGFGGIDLSKLGVDIIRTSFFKFLGNIAIIVFVILFCYFLMRYIFQEQINRTDIIWLAFCLILFFTILFWTNFANAIMHLILLPVIIFSLPGDFRSKIRFITIFYFIDFFLNGYLNLLFKMTNGDLFYIVPLFQITVFLLCAKVEQSKGLKILYSSFIVFIVISAVGHLIYNVNIMQLSKQLSPDKIKVSVADFYLGGFKNFVGFFSSGWSSFYQSTFNYTYSGTQEESEDPQGVFLKAVDRGELKYWEGSPVYVFALLEAKTLDKQMEIKVSCKTIVESDGEEVEKKGIINEEDKTNPYEITVPVFTGVERNLPCLFEDLPVGSYEIEFNADFDFAADSTQKIYLMERERMLNDFRVLSDKGLEPTKENILSQIYDIQDTNPESIYTTGPVELAIGTDKVPWDLAETNNIKPLFGLTLGNLWQDGGEIEKINTIYLKVPEKMRIQENTCTGIPFTVESSTEDQKKEGGYTVYKLQPNQDLIGEIKDSATLGCFITINNEALDPSPVTTRYLKAHIDYTYRLTEKIDLEVEASPLSGEEEEVEGRSS